MKTKWILMVLALLVVCSMSSSSQGADRFYFGSWGGKDYPSDLRDSLRFNILKDLGIDSSNIGSLAACTLRAIVHPASGEYNPTNWAHNSHYTLWEAEGFEGSYYSLSYNGGTLVNDVSASGGKAMCFSGPGTPGLIQTGPTYFQEDSLWGYAIEYTAEFCLKFRYSLYQPRGPRGPGPPTPVCSIMVVDALRDSILNARALYKNQFPIDEGYQTFPLGYTLPTDTVYGRNNSIEFQIYWFGIPETKYFWIDYVKVYDEMGGWLMSGERDSAIIDYVSQSWVCSTFLPTGETAVYRWLGRDEPPTIDLFRPHEYVDSLLKQASTERVLLEPFVHISDSVYVHEYLLRADPADFCVDIYPMYRFGHNTTGHNYQNQWSEHIKLLDFVQTQADSVDKDFWLVTQAYTVADTCTTASCEYCAYPLVSWKDTIWCPAHRDPSGNELRLQTFLGLCYGADAIMYFTYDWRVNGNGRLLLGLHDPPPNDSTTYKWREIRDFMGPRVEKLGAVLSQLDWQGACLDDEVGSFVPRNGHPNYIDSITSSDEPHWVEVGFFSADTGQYTNYLMLVNRECLQDEAADYDVYFTAERAVYQIRDMYTDCIIGAVSGSGDKFEVHLEAGEGRLFRLEPRYLSSRVIQVPHDSSCIQCAIDEAQNGDTVLVAPGIYNEHINFHGKGIVVGSYYILFEEASYISDTKIDGTDALLDTASVVTFVSGEDSSSVIAGFEITGGRGTSDDEYYWRYGGGVYCYASSPIVRNNRIWENEARIYAGIRRGCGGGICCRGSDCAPTISSNHIFDNESNFGGGIYSLESSPRIVNNLIEINTACTLSGAWGEGGGIYSKNSTPLIVNNALSRNVAQVEGGGIGLYGLDAATVTNNVIYGSEPDDVYLDDAWANDISYCDFWENGLGDSVHFAGDVLACYGDTTWGSNRNGIPCDTFYNIFRDPSWDGGYLRPDSSSACIDAGDNDAPGLPETGFDGNPRIVDGNGDDSAFVDMGAYEYHPEGSGGPAKIAVGDKEDTESKSSSLPQQFSLSQNYPNPFNPTTVLEFDIAKSARVRLKIYNILGQLVRVLMDEEKTPGSYAIYWDGNDKNGRAVSSGIYFYRIEAGEFAESKKMVILK